MLSFGCCKAGCCSPAASAFTPLATCPGIATYNLSTPRRLRRRRRFFVEAELRSSLEQINRNPFCERVCDSEHALRPPFQILERRHALVEIVERGTVDVHVERLRVIQPHFERESMSFSENASRHGNHFAKQRFAFFETLWIRKGRHIVVGRPEGSLIFLAIQYLVYGSAIQRDIY